MRRRFNQEFLITSPPQLEKKEFKYEKKLRPFNIWFRNQISESGGLMKFCRSTKISYQTARFWTYKTYPRIHHRYDICKYLGREKGVHYLNILSEMENIRIISTV
jgi:hypothetical protein